MRCIIQTFLPFPDFKESARCLDRERLGKQRVECLQILNSLLRNGGWSSHPAVLMWRHYEDALIAYGLEICDQFQRRGYKDSTFDKIHSFWHDYPDQIPEQQDVKMPPWLGDERLHKSHRSNLIRKAPYHYQYCMKWTEPPDLPYFWPGAYYARSDG
jgi:hypothetical protein